MKRKAFNIGMVANYKNIGCLLCILCASTFGSNILAQSGKMDRNVFLNEYAFKGNHVLFTFGALSASKANLKNWEGNHAINSTRSFSLLLALKYRINFSNNYSLNTGAEAGFIGRNYVVAFDKDDFSPP